MALSVIKSKGSKLECMAKEEQGMGSDSSSSTASPMIIKPWVRPIRKLLKGEDVKISAYQFRTIPEMFRTLVPEYKSHVFERPFIARVRDWSNEYAPRIRAINPDRAERRLASYVNPDELARARRKVEVRQDCSIRFGVEKLGRGYHGARGDFCLVAAAIERRNLTLFYRSIEMIGGFSYDLCIVEELCERLGTSFKTVTFCAARANIFALKRNSNETLYPKLLEIFK